MAKPKKNRRQTDQAGDGIQIPIFYKLMVSMLFVAAVPIFLLSIVAVGGTQSIISVLGLMGTIGLVTLVTITAILICSYYLSGLIARPIVQLSEMANDLSRGIVVESDLPVKRNDEIGTLSRAFSKMVSTYRLLDTLAQEQK
jgi:methyl-accepting chemotaxis protein